MQFTYSCRLELSLHRSLPGFCEEISQYQFADGLDRGASFLRLELGPLVIEHVQEPLARQVAERAADRLADTWAKQFFRTDGPDAIACPCDWRSFGRVDLNLIPNDPGPAWTHGMAGENPAILCPVCNTPMVMRQGRKPFWGCQRYPACKGTRSVS